MDTTDDDDGDWPDVDEDWSDDGDEDEPIACPECRTTIYADLDKCPKCGYWLTAADRRALRPGEMRPLWQRFTAVVLIVLFLLILLKIGLTIF